MSYSSSICSDAPRPVCFSAPDFVPLGQYVADNKMSISFKLKSGLTPQSNNQASPLYGYGVQKVDLTGDATFITAPSLRGEEQNQNVMSGERMYASFKAAAGMGEKLNNEKVSQLP